MGYAYILLLWIALASASAYRQIYNPSFYEQQNSRLYRSSDVGIIDIKIDRSQNERSIPFRSHIQSIDPDSFVTNDEPQPRNGNTSHRSNPFSKIYPIISSRRGNPADLDSSIVFPGPTSRQHQFVPEIPEECKSMGFCESVPNYPHDYVESIILKTKDAKYRFNLDKETPEIAQRAGPEEENLELCQSNETIIYPSAAKNIQGNWVLVVNNKHEPVQGFKAEICKRASLPCSDIAYFDEDKYNATCHQKTAHRMLWSLNRNGEMVLETVALPTCCTCLVRIIRT